jgi:hypothetical protein
MSKINPRSYDTLGAGSLFFFLFAQFVSELGLLSAGTGIVNLRAK